MAIVEHVTASFVLPDFMVSSSLDDLSDAELMVRPMPTMNHWKWQLGHLIASENFHLDALGCGVMPALPAGFAEAFTKETAASDDAAAFPSKAALVEEMARQRAGTIATLSKLSDEALLAPSPEPIRYFGPTVGAVFAGEVAHWMLHIGQLIVIRKHLGKPTF